MPGDEDTKGTLTERLVERGKRDRTTLDRLFLGRGDESSIPRDEHERLYFFLDARGAFSTSSLGARWQYRLRSDTAVFVPAGVEHRLTNSGDAPLRAIVFTARLPEGERASEPRGGPTFADLHDVPQRNMTSFLTQTLFAGADVKAHVFVLSEYQTILPGGCVPRHVHEIREELCYVCSGQGNLHLEGSDRVIRAGEAARIPPGAWHSMTNEGNAALEYIIAQSSHACEGPAREAERSEGADGTT